MLKQAGIAFGRLSDMEDVVHHPQNHFVTVETEGGAIDLLAPGAQVSQEEMSFGAVPAPNEQGDAIRAEFSI